MPNPLVLGRCTCRAKALQRLYLFLNRPERSRRPAASFQPKGEFRLPIERTMGYSENTSSKDSASNTQSAQVSMVSGSALATPARASAAQRDDDTLVRVLGQAVGKTRLASRLAPARLALRARRWFPEGGSEEGGLLELRLSWARRASSSWMRSRSCSIGAACSTTSARSRSRSWTGFSGERLGACGSGMKLGYTGSSRFGKGA